MSDEPAHRLETEHLFSYGIRFRAAPEVIGMLPEGLRINVYYGGGTAKGPRVVGSFRPVGAGRLVLRRDGVGILESRATIETNDGAVIETSLSGMLDVGTEGFARALEGEWPERIAFRGAPRYDSADPRYAWLTRRLCISVGDIEPTRPEAVSADIYAVL